MANDIQHNQAIIVQSHYSSIMITLIKYMYMFTLHTIIITLSVLFVTSTNHGPRSDLLASSFGTTF